MKKSLMIVSFLQVEFPIQDYKMIKSLKEFDLIKNYVTDKRKFIYFSSIHVLDPSENNSMYAKHKIEIEDFIKIILNLLLFIDYL